MESLINESLDKIREICIRHKVVELYVFGSVITPDFDAVKSDIDLAVVFQKDIPFDIVADNYFGFIEELEQLFGKPVDLVSLDYVKNPYFKEELENTMRPIYAT